MYFITIGWACGWDAMIMKAYRNIVGNSLEIFPFKYRFCAML
jgi:hypothetical protein